MRAKALHDMRMCLTIQGVWHVKHCGCCFCLSMKEKVVWQIRNRDIMICSLLDFLKSGLHSPKVDLIWKSLLWILLFQRCCYFVWRNLLILGFKSVYRILNLSGAKSKADLTAESALSFPLTPTWLGIRDIMISLQFNTELSLFYSLMIQRFSSFLLLDDSRTESEPENMITFLCLFFEMILRATSIALASAVKIELSIERDFLELFYLEQLRTLFCRCYLSHPWKHRWSGWCSGILRNISW